MKEITVKRVLLEQMNPAPYNPRVKLEPGDPEYDALENSMQEYGCVELIVWNEATGNIVGGHRRYDILMAAGEKETVVSVVHLENLIDEKALNAALNNIHGRNDNEKLLPILAELKEAGKLALTGFDALEVDRMLSGVELDINEFFEDAEQKEKEHAGEIQCPHCGEWFKKK